MAVTLRSGKVLDDPIIKPKTKPSEKQDRSRIAIESERTRDSKNGSGGKSQGEDNQCIKVPKVKTYVQYQKGNLKMCPSLTLKGLRKGNYEQYQKFVEMLNKLQVNMPFS